MPTKSPSSYYDAQFLLADEPTVGLLTADEVNEATYLAELSENAVFSKYSSLKIITDVMFNTMDVYLDDSTALGKLVIMIANTKATRDHDPKDVVKLEAECMVLKDLIAMNAERTKSHMKVAHDFMNARIADQTVADALEHELAAAYGP